MRNVSNIERPTATFWRRCARRMTWVILAGVMLAGCDRCGDWVSPIPGSTMSCRQDGPKPQ